MPILNLTPHNINIINPSGAAQTIVSSGVARVSGIPTEVGMHEGIRLVRTSYGPVTGLPEYKDGVILIVSAMVRNASPGRHDLVSPSDLVRDSTGNIIGCKGLEIN